MAAMVLPKKTPMTNNKSCREEVEDRLSSLPNEILIDILSRLPLTLAVQSETLSKRWHLLWRNITYITLTTPNFKPNSLFKAAFNDILKKLTSPFIHRFSIELDCEYKSDGSLAYKSSIDSLFSRIIKRKISELKLSWPGCNSRSLKAPSFIFQTTSLVSLELGSGFYWSLPGEPDNYKDNNSSYYNSYDHDDDDDRDREDDDNDEDEEVVVEVDDEDGDEDDEKEDNNDYDSYAINLPNLKMLSVYIPVPTELKRVEIVIKACPSLEELSFEFEHNCRISGCKHHAIECYSKSLRRLFVEVSGKIQVSIKAPKLEYFSFDARSSTAMFHFDKKPKGLQVAKIRDLDGGKKRVSEVFRAISRVSVLELKVNPLRKCRMFHNVTHLTLTMNFLFDFTTILSFLQLCPALEVMVLNHGDISVHGEKWVFPKLEPTHTLCRIKRIDIDTTLGLNHQRTRYFSELIEYLLRSALLLEQLNFSVAKGLLYWGKESVNDIVEERELRSCKLLYQGGISFGRDVGFVGNYYRMSRKAGPKAWRADGKVIYFD